MKVMKCNLGESVPASPLQTCVALQGGSCELHSGDTKRAWIWRRGNGAGRRPKTNSPALESDKVEKENNCFVKEDQVDICENLIVICQTPEKIDADTQAAAERLQSREEAGNCKSKGRVWRYFIYVNMWFHLPHKTKKLFWKIIMES